MPQFIALIVYSGAVALCVTSFALSFPVRSQVLSLVVLMLLGIITVLLILGNKIHRSLLNVLVFLVVIGFFFLAADTIGTALSLEHPLGVSIEGNLRYLDGPSAEGFLVSVPGQQAEVRTGPQGYFSLKVANKNLANDKLKLHVESLDNRFAKDIWMSLSDPSAYLPIKSTEAPLPTAPETKFEAVSRSQLPSGHRVLLEGFTHYDTSAFIFRTGTVVPWGAPADIGVSNTNPPGSKAKLFMPYELPPYSDSQTNAGAIKMTHSALDAVTECPLEGYQFHWVDVFAGEVLCIRTRDGKHFAKIKIAAVLQDRISFDWVYQPSGSREF